MDEGSGTLAVLCTPIKEFPIFPAFSQCYDSIFCLLHFKCYSHVLNTESSPRQAA